MLCIHSNNTDPYFNLAAEEYLLKNFKEDCFMLWRSDNAIVVGKHQNALAELNLNFVRENNIKVARRISGGGTVFHDLGNLNFSFIVNTEEGNQIDFKRFTLPVLEVLKELGVEAKFEGRNDLRIEGKKFSGNAEHVWKNRTLHHGTILFSSKISDLSDALKVVPEKYVDKAVKSVRSVVTNISDYLKIKMDVTGFAEKLMNHMLKNNSASLYGFTDQDVIRIEKLREDKFIQWEWNFGYSPKYSLKNILAKDDKSLEISVEVVKGYIIAAKIDGDIFDLSFQRKIADKLISIKHNPDTLYETLGELMDENKVSGELSIEELVKGFF